MKAVGPSEALQLLVFDLDGTLVDSQQDLASSVNHVRAYLDLPPLDLVAIRPAIGDGARSLVQRCLPHAFHPRLDEAMPVFHAHYEDHCTDTTVLYPGVKTTLDALRGFKLAILTNKPYKPACTILKTLGVLDAFSPVVGGDTYGVKKPNPQGLRAILDLHRVAPQAALMVGDGVPDVEVARACDVRCAAILNGIGLAQRLSAAGPDYSLDSIEALVDLVAALV